MVGSELNACHAVRGVLRSFVIRGLHGEHHTIDLTGRRYLYMHGLASVMRGTKSEALLKVALREGGSMTRFDMRGHGKSVGSLLDLRISDLIQDTEAVLDRIGGGLPHVLVGSSLGGLVASWVCARRPELVAGLVLLAPAFEFCSRICNRAHRLKSKQGKTLLRLPSSYVPDGFITLSEEVVHDVVANGLDNEMLLASQIKTPVFIAHGELDDVVPPHTSMKFLERVEAPTHMMLVPGGDHRLNREIGSVLEQSMRFLKEQNIR